MATSPMSIYQQALSNQNQIYSQVNAGYAKLRDNLVRGQTATLAGYNRLGNQVQGLLGDVGRYEAEQIARDYTAQSGQQAQDLVSRGLGNTTIQQSVQRGLTLDKQLADIKLQGDIGNLKAGYMSNIGLAGLGYQGQAQMNVANLGAQGLQTRAGMGSTFASLYGGMAGAAQYEQQLEYQKQQDIMNRVYGGGMAQQQAIAAAGNQSQAMGLAQDQLGLKYAALGAEQQQGRANMQYQYAQLGQQNQQFGRNLDQQAQQFSRGLDLAYDRTLDEYGWGAPTSYMRPAPELRYGPRTGNASRNQIINP